MPTNDFKPFAVGGSATVVTQATYAAAATLLANGFQVGLADPLYLNKVWRQSSLMSAVIGELVMAQTGQNVVDDGTLATILLNLTNAIKFLALSAVNGRTTIATTGGTTVLTATQAAVGFIVVTGALTSNAVISFPAAGAVAKWEVINSTTGAFTLQTIATGGTGVFISQGMADSIICDGTNVRFDNSDAITQSPGNSTNATATTAFVQNAVSSVGGYYQDTGLVANAYVITPIPPLVGYVTGQSFRIRTTRTNTGAATLDAGLGPKALIIESGGAAVAGDIHGLFTVTYDSTIGAGSWVLNGEAMSELGALAKLNIGAYLLNDGAGNLAVDATALAPLVAVPQTLLFFVGNF